MNVTVQPDQVIRNVDRRMFGLNAAVWDGAYASPNTTALLNELGNQSLRFPGGSLSDVYHWETNRSEGQTSCAGRERGVLAPPATIAYGDDTNRVCVPETLE